MRSVRWVGCGFICAPCRWYCHSIFLDMVQAFSKLFCDIEADISICCHYQTFCLLFELRVQFSFFLFDVPPFPLWTIRKFGLCLGGSSHGRGWICKLVCFQSIYQCLSTTLLIIYLADKIIYLISLFSDDDLKCSLCTCFNHCISILRPLLCSWILTYPLDRTVRNQCCSCLLCSFVLKKLRKTYHCWQSQESGVSYILFLLEVTVETYQVICVPRFRGKAPYIPEKKHIKFSLSKYEQVLECSTPLFIFWLCVGERGSCTLPFNLEFVFSFALWL